MEVGLTGTTTTRKRKKQKLVQEEEQSTPQEEEPDNVSYIRNYDIICGRERVAFNNVGNRRFRITISLHVKRYMAASNRRETKAVIQSVCDLLVNEAGARFLKRKSKGRDTFIVLDEREARNKIQHALRDMAATMMRDMAATMMPFEDEYQQGSDDEEEAEESGMMMIVVDRGQLVDNNHTQQDSPRFIGQSSPECTKYPLREDHTSSLSFLELVPVFKNNEDDDDTANYDDASYSGRDDEDGSSVLTFRTKHQEAGLDGSSCMVIEDS
jgi:hypothetical protein